MIFHRSAVMKFEIADWRFEVTLDGLLCQPIERGQAKAAKKSDAQQEQRKSANKPERHVTGTAVQTFNKQAQQKGATK
jgi:hypothetical protein